MCDSEEVAEFRVVLAALYALDRGAVDAGHLRQFFLGQVCVDAGVTDPPP